MGLNKFGLVFIFVLILLMGISLVQSAETVGMDDATVCCEKTKSGLYCQDVKAEDCASERQPPTACDSTSFCKPGWCYDSTQGVCWDNVAQKVCNDNNGTWNAQKPDACNYGCCILDDQASFVTLVRCKKLSGFYGLTTNWNSGIANEAQCILTAGAQEEGACVFMRDFEKTCKFTAKGTCTTDNMAGGTTPGTTGTGLTAATNTVVNGSANNSGTGTTTAAILPLVNAQTATPSNSNPTNAQTQNAEVTFYPGKLCSAEELGTNCGPTRNTICVAGKEEVYFVDSCGNPANIYDASKVNDLTYWSNIVKKDTSCGAGGNSKESQTCGNCNYLLGTYCREATSTQPTYGTNICQDLNCIDKDGKARIHGESWCFYDGGSTGAPGSKYFRQLCRNGEIKVEPCADFRQEECIESSQGGFSQAACRVNRWQDCTSQKEQLTCENSDKRDCKWLNGIGYVLLGSMMNGTSGSGTGTTANAGSLDALAQGIKRAGGLKNIPKGACVPKIPPGLNSWTEGEATAVCSQANAVCPVTLKKGLIGGSWDCDSSDSESHCECLPGGQLEQQRVELCKSLGDCGPKTNYVGQQGSGPGYKTTTQENKDSSK
jgi:hypothetical protein